LLPLALASGACASADPVVEESDSAIWRLRYDADDDGRLARSEYPRSERAFANLDVNGDQVVSAEDFDPRHDVALRGPWAKAPLEYGEGGPEVGDPAPPIRLRSLAGEVVDLASFGGQRPVALVFGSFT
jgi:hypothetical protein